jgi:signal transduction histidine kinase
LAILNFEKSKEFSQQIKDSAFYASANREIASIQSEIKLEAKQEGLIKEGLELSLKKGKLQDQLKSYEQLYAFYKSKKEPAKAMEYLEKYYQLKDSIGGIDQQLALVRMEEEYNRSKNEKEIELLQKDKEIAASKLKQQRTKQAAFALLFFLSFLSGWLLFSRYRLKQKAKQQQEMEKIRSHIARDLHDEVGSSLSSINMLSAMARDQIKNPTLSETLLEKVKTNAAETMERMSDIVWMIKPGSDAGSQLKERMQRILNELMNDHGVEVEANLSATESRRMNMEVKKNVYLIFREAVNNAMKYSGMKKLRVKMTVSDNLLQVLVADDGKGFDIDKVQRGNGLDNMQERAKEIGGNLQVKPGQPGTIVELLVKLEG